MMSCKAKSELVVRTRIAGAWKKMEGIGKSARKSENPNGEALSDIQGLR